MDSVDPALMVGSTLVDASGKVAVRITSLIGSGSFAHVYAAEEVETSVLAAVAADRLLSTSPVNTITPSPSANFFTNLASAGGTPTSPSPLSTSTTGVKRAVKRLFKKGLDARQLMLQRQEVAIMKALQSPNIVQLLATVEDEECLYMIMEYCELDLYEAITQQGGFPEDVVKEVFGQIADAVIFCHSKGFFHRDLKPENCLISTSDFKIKLADFGLATTDSWSTEMGCGSVRYMAPECFEVGHTPAEPTVGPIPTFGPDGMPLVGYAPAPNDTWALGVILLNLLFGKNPWFEAFPTDAIFAAFTGTNPNILRQQFDLSPHFDAVLRRCFDLDPRRRCSVTDLKILVDSLPRFVGGGIPMVIPATPNLTAIISSAVGMPGCYGLVLPQGTPIPIGYPSPPASKRSRIQSSSNMTLSSRPGSTASSMTDLFTPTAAQPRTAAHRASVEGYERPESRQRSRRSRRKTMDGEEESVEERARMREVIRTSDVGGDARLKVSDAEEAGRKNLKSSRRRSITKATDSARKSLSRRLSANFGFVSKAKPTSGDSTVSNTPRSTSGDSSYHSVTAFSTPVTQSPVSRPSGKALATAPNAAPRTVSVKILAVDKKIAPRIIPPEAPPEASSTTITASSSVATGGIRTRDSGYDSSEMGAATTTTTTASALSTSPLVPNPPAATTGAKEPSLKRAVVESETLRAATVAQKSSRVSPDDEDVKGKGPLRVERDGEVEKGVLEALERIRREDELRRTAEMVLKQDDHEEGKEEVEERESATPTPLTDQPVPSTPAATSSTIQVEGDANGKTARSPSPRLWFAPIISRETPVVRERGARGFGVFARLKMGKKASRENIRVLGAAPPARKRSGKWGRSWGSSDGRPPSAMSPEPPEDGAGDVEHPEGYVRSSESSSVQASAPLMDGEAAGDNFAGAAEEESVAAAAGSWSKARGARRGLKRISSMSLQGMVQSVKNLVVRQSMESSRQAGSATSPSGRSPSIASSIDEGTSSGGWKVLRGSIGGGSYVNADETTQDATGSVVSSASSVHSATARSHFFAPRTSWSRDTPSPAGSADSAGGGPNSTLSHSPPASPSRGFLGNSGRVMGLSKKSSVGNWRVAGNSRDRIPRPPSAPPTLV
ncbi:hypothetical protein HK101_003208 [Irineochytrium annulatum]|nr:hypothetical protein HK101_003208 [Irineochytrium annulatum]